MCDLPLPGEVILGERRVTVGEVMKFRPGMTLTIDRPTAGGASLLINGVLIAHGEVMADASGFRFRVNRVAAASGRARKCAAAKAGGRAGAH